MAIALTTLIFIANLLLHPPLIESLSTSLATGTRQLARRKVLVKRLVCIEDLGDMDILVIDRHPHRGADQIHRRAVILP
ncbi:hypothetical protein BMF89_05510 [Arthrobacter sp. SRS-W-1-2016]|uniref:hypothetical protein n=1 Tax=Arthrobacter sp. SRS-W-1-2016 TaxID=1930254 RepID=UPI0009CF0537|nr:hypothetical protein [Arthrobacter sp. SRS-W-1-2016]OOP63736.1 hypothetical protein BMF89_05510 [Arthrobacter sp. SRS-W-1-2016]